MLFRLRNFECLGRSHRPSYNLDVTAEEATLCDLEFARKSRVSVPMDLSVPVSTVIT